MYQDRLELVEIRNGMEDKGGKDRKESALEQGRIHDYQSRIARLLAKPDGGTEGQTERRRDRGTKRRREGGTERRT